MPHGLAAWGVLFLGAMSLPLAGPEGEGAPGSRLDLRLKLPRPVAGIEGAWVYQPLDGTDRYRVDIRRTEGGFYEYEAWREGGTHPVLQLDHAGEGSHYRGEVGPGFDPCVPPGARFSLLPTVDGLVFEPSLPVGAPVPLAAAGSPCAEAAHYVLTAKGHGDEVRLRPPSDLPGAAPPPESSHENPKGPFRSEAERSPERQTPTAKVTLGAPSAPDGTPVLLLGSLRDPNQHVWHHVRLLTVPPAAEGEGGAIGAAEGEGSGAMEKAHGAAATPRAERSGGAEASKTGKPSRPAEPPSGYVPAENLAVRWECRLARAPAREPETGRAGER